MSWWSYVKSSAWGAWSYVKSSAWGAWSYVKSSAWGAWSYVKRYASRMWGRRRSAARMARCVKGLLRETLPFLERIWGHEFPLLRILPCTLELVLVLSDIVDAVHRMLSAAETAKDGATLSPPSTKKKWIVFANKAFIALQVVTTVLQVSFALYKHRSNSQWELVVQHVLRIFQGIRDETERYMKGQEKEDKANVELVSGDLTAGKLQFTYSIRFQMDGSLSLTLGIRDEIERYMKGHEKEDKANVELVSEDLTAEKLQFTYSIRF